MSAPRNRFPPLRKGADGRYVCRGCHGPVPKGRRTWCSRECKEKYDPYWVKIAVATRERGLCQKCFCQVRIPWQAFKACWPDGPKWGYHDVMRRLPRGEYHHVVPFSEGGAGTADNIQLLCRDCHKAVTAAWRKSKTKGKD